jgi:hypothetical protein
MSRDSQITKNQTMKIAQLGVFGIVLALSLAVDVQAQNVGIGTSSPASKLTVNGSLAVGADYTTTAAPSNGALIEGNTGIGLTAPQVPLHVDGRVYVSPGGVTGDFWAGSANMNGVEFDNSGWIGVQRSIGHCLHLSKPSLPNSTTVDGLLLGFYVNSNIVGEVVTSGSVVSYNTTSDERLKDNIRPTAKGLNELMTIQVSDYNFKSKPGTNETGFIAQQLYTVFPDAVTVGGENAAEKPWSVDYGRVTPLLARAIQEQQGEINALRAENAKLEAENAKLERTNKRLAEISSQMEALKKAVANIQKKHNGGVRTVALEQ